MRPDKVGGFKWLCTVILRTDLVDDERKMATKNSRRWNTSNAVWSHHLFKSYGKGKNKISVISDLKLNVPYGAIYGLLGPSGCGKTTLLRCIVGLLKVDSGSLLTMGDIPGARGHSVPGSMVGYMPQEISLYNELTIEELLRFFGRVHGMTSNDITDRTAFLLDFLKLPACSSRIECLSGGQKRRVSLAAALLHKPGLLILDEPTVGVDPLLREKIWEHLLDIAKSQEQTTIIITTHYIEEARQANRVGLMRGGRLLEEDNPLALMERYSKNNLESIFLHLCHHDIIENAKDEELMTLSQSNNFVLDSNISEEGAVNFDNKPLVSGVENPTSRTSLLSTAISHEYGAIKVESLPRVKPSARPCCIIPSPPSIWKIMALVIKNMIILKRSIGLLIFEFLIPSIQVILFCLCIGHIPHDLKLAVVNCDQGNLGSKYLTYLSNDTFKQVSYNDLDKALASVENGNTWGVLEINSNFSDFLVKRFLMGINVTTDIILGSTVKLHLDLTSQQISSVIESLTLKSFQIFSRDMLVIFGFSSHFSDAPVALDTPVYGSDSSIFTDFMSPGICNSIIFFLATGLTTMSFVLERKDGLYERNLVNGVAPVEVMMSHVITQFLILLVQVSLLLLCTFVIFKNPLEGSFLAVMSLVLLEGLCGMCLGILISCCCDKETSAMQISLAIVFPLLLISGIIWPIEAVPDWLYYISEALPLTISTDALRSVMFRGWGISHLGVGLGFLLVIGWSAVFLVLTAIIVRIRQ